MNNPTEKQGINRKRLFAGICLALVPTGAQFALIANVLGQWKVDFLLSNAQVGFIAGTGIGAMAISLLLIGPWLEKFGMRVGTALAFFGHIIGLLVIISAVTLTGDPAAFWVLLIGAMLLAIGNGMIEVAGNPLTTALFPDDKTTKLNRFHAFFPIGIVGGALIGAGLNFLEGGPLHFMYHWTFQLGIIGIPMLIYAAMVLPQTFPKTEYGESGLPFGEMFSYTFTRPFLYLMLIMLGLALCIELGSGRWIGEIFYHAEFGGAAILLIAWFSMIMIALRIFASHFVRWLTPPGMLFVSALILCVALLVFSVAEGPFTAFIAATLFGMGVAFNFPTMVGIVAERLPRAGSLGIVLVMGFGLLVGGLVGTPGVGWIADTQLARYLDEDERREQVTAVVFGADGAEGVFRRELERIDGMTVDELLAEGVTYVPEDFELALSLIVEAKENLQVHGGRIEGVAIPRAMREIGVVPMDHPVVHRSRELIGPAEAWGGQRALMLISPAAFLMMIVFGVMFFNDRRRGGYRARKLTTETTPEE